MRKTAFVCLVALSWTVTSVLAAVDIPGQNQGPTQMSPDYPELDGSDLRSGLRGAGVGMGIDGMGTGGMDPGGMDPGGMDPGGERMVEDILNLLGLLQNHWQLCH